MAAVLVVEHAEAPWSAAAGDLVCGPLRVRRDRRRGIDVCTIRGEIDLGTAPLLRRVLARDETGWVPRIVDLSGVGFLGLAGARVLLTSAELARARQRRLSLVVATRHVRRVLELTGVAGRVPVYSYLDDAVLAEADPRRLHAGRRP